MRIFGSCVEIIELPLTVRSGACACAGGTIHARASDNAATVFHMTHLIVPLGIGAGPRHAWRRPVMGGYRNKHAKAQRHAGPRVTWMPPKSSWRMACPRTARGRPLHRKRSAPVRACLLRDLLAVVAERAQVVAHGVHLHPETVAHVAAPVSQPRAHGVGGGKLAELRQWNGLSEHHRLRHRGDV